MIKNRLVQAKSTAQTTLRKALGVLHCCESIQDGSQVGSLSCLMR